MTDFPDLPVDLRDRIVRLERQCRRMRRLLALAFLIPTMLLLFGVGQLRSAAIAAQRFELRSADGALRAALYVSEHDEACLSLMGANEHPQAGLWVDRDGHSRLWGFQNEEPALAARSGKIIVHEARFRLIEQEGDRWTFAYTTTIENDRSRPTRGALDIEFITADGFVLAKRGEYLRLAPGQRRTFAGEAEVPAQRAEQISDMRITPVAFK